MNNIKNNYFTNRTKTCNLLLNTTEDVVNFDNPNSNQTNQFTLGTDSSIQLDKV